jgi:prefoldin subunit 5
MAFDFLGTFSKQDLENLRTYLQSQVDKVDTQINHMTFESNKLQKTMQTLLDYSSSQGFKFKMFDTSFYRKVSSQFDDSDSATVVQITKEPYYRNIKSREVIEFKIKKILDKIEQIQEQIHLLRISKDEFTVNIQTINSMFSIQRPYLTVETQVG